MKRCQESAVTPPGLRSPVSGHVSLTLRASLASWRPWTSASGSAFNGCQCGVRASGSWLRSMYRVCSCLALLPLVCPRPPVCQSERVAASRVPVMYRYRARPSAGRPVPMTGRPRRQTQSRPRTDNRAAFACHAHRASRAPSRRLKQRRERRRHGRTGDGSWAVSVYLGIVGCVAVFFFVWGGLG